jgi:hypothetical protein
MGSPWVHHARDGARPFVGGWYRFTMQPPDGEPFHLSGQFLESTHRAVSSTPSAGNSQILTTAKPEDVPSSVELRWRAR